MINLLNFFKINNDMNVHIENNNDSGEAIINESQQTVEIQEEENQRPNDSPEVSVEDSKKEIERSIQHLNDELSTIKHFLPIIQKEVESIKQYLIDADLQRVISVSDTVNNIRLTSADISKEVKTILSKTCELKPDICNSASLNQESNKKLDEMCEVLANIDYNIRVGANTGNTQDSQYTQILQEKINEYESDLHLKLMRKYVIDSQLSLYNQIVLRLKNIGSNIELENILKLITSKLEGVGVRTVKSKSGDSFNPRTMKTGNYPNVQTTDPLLEGKVAESVSPSFVWNLPSVRQQTSQLVLQEEEVRLYEFTKSNN